MAKATIKEILQDPSSKGDKKNYCELLLKDLCGRLPYGVIIHLVESNEDEELYCLNIPQEGLYTRSLEHNYVTTLSPIEGIKPYLRSMSSMTEGEKDTYDTLTMCNAPWVVNDWLNAHHFDYRGLIEKGLALEAPEGMYNLNK